VDCRFFTDGSGRAALLQTVAYLDDAERTWFALGNAAGTATVGDGASVPRILWPIFGHPYASDHQRAAWLHDRAYQQAAPCSPWQAMFCDQRALVDAMFYEAMVADVETNPRPFASRRCPLARWRLISRAVRWLLSEFAEHDDLYAMFLGVRLFGWWPWWKHGRANLRRSKDGKTDVG
jgi:hypothetical protein